MKNKKWKNEVSAIAGIVLFYFLIECMGVTCPILYLTGVSCAGCGMSRAWLAVLHGNFAAAIHFHPLFWMAVPMGILFLLRGHMGQRTKKGIVIVIAVLFLGVYLLRMFKGTGEIVYFKPESGLIARGFTYILQIFLT